MSKKKVAVLLPWMKMGGTNKIALNFMKDLLEYFEVTLVLSQNTGELLSEIPSEIHVIIDELIDFKTIFKSDIKEFKLRNIYNDFVYYLKIKLGKDSVDNYKYLVSRQNKICDEHFDCAISYHGQSPERLLNLLYRIDSEKKVAWIHGEFNNSEGHYRKMERYYSKLDHMFFVSNHTMESFANKMILDRDKSTVYYNPINKNEILNLSKAKCDVDFSGEYTNILTVGRISKEKGQDMIPYIVKNLEEKGLKIRWYIIGDGDNRHNVEQNIHTCGVEEAVIIGGVKNNPYCYMKKCDIYVQPSYTEGYSTTICEAGILGKAIIGTKPSGGIYDQITNGEDGLIVDATIEGITCAIEQLITEPEKILKYEENIVKKNFEGKGEIEKFVKVIM